MSFKLGERYSSNKKVLVVNIKVNNSSSNDNY